MAENVAQLVINRGRSGTKSLRKGDLLQIRTQLIMTMPGTGRIRAIAIPVEAFGHKRLMR